MAIDRDFLLAFGRDVDFHDPIPLSTYLDRLTGDILWLYNCDDEAESYFGIGRENRAGWDQVFAEPERYLKIPGLGHGEHHEILRRFLRSNWTGDEEHRRGSAEAYRGSIGRWKRNVRDSGAVRAFLAFRDEQIEKTAEEFLRENDIVPEWR